MGLLKKEIYIVFVVYETFRVCGPCENKLGYNSCVD